jgi:hypothetical protein
MSVEEGSSLQAPGGGVVPCQEVRVLIHGITVPAQCTA